MIDRPVRLAEYLDIDTSLAWKVWKVGLGEGSYPAAAHIPGEAGFERFLTAAERAGVGATAISHAREAYANLNELLRVHGGDRASGVIMLGFLSDAGRTRTELAVRRSAFRANAHFLGVQARALYQLDICTRAASGVGLSVIRARGHFGLQRTRVGVTWMLGRSTPVIHSGPTGASRSPLDLGNPRDAESPWLLPQFCSHPMPEVVRRTINGVTTEDELAPGPVGQTGASDIVLGERIENVPVSDAVQDALTMWVATPAEHLCYDVVMEDGLTTRDVQARLHSTVHGDLPYLRGETRDMIPMPEDFRPLGFASSCPPTTNVPRQEELFAWCIARAGVDPARLRVWRLRMKLPPVPTCVAAIYAPARASKPGA